MAALSRLTRALIEYGAGEDAVAGYIRHWYRDGAWRGDSCGCPDDRCIGYHHDGPDDCGCLPVALAEYIEAELAAGPR